MPNPAPPRIDRLVTAAMLSVAVVVIAIGLWLWLSSEGGAVPAVSIGLWVFGAVELVGAAALRRVFARQSARAATGYPDGDRPPGML